MVEDSFLTNEYVRQCKVNYGLPFEPQVIRDNKYLGDGVFLVEGEKKLGIYVASSWGFDVGSMRDLVHEIYPKLNEIGYLPLCPFVACGEYLQEKEIGHLDDELQKMFLGSVPTVDDSHQTHFDYWNVFDREIVSRVNYGVLMNKMGAFLALLDRYGPSVDEGVAYEMREAKDKVPIVAIRTYLSNAENVAARINPAVNDAIIYGDSRNRLFGSQFVDDMQDFKTKKLVDIGAYVEAFKYLAEINPFN